MKTFLFCIILLVVCLCAQPVPARLPPQILETTPPDGGNLVGDTIILKGSTLDAVDPETLRIMDVTTNTEVDFSSSITCHWKSHRFLACWWPWSPPGSCQSYCTIHVTLQQTNPGHAYVLTFLEKTIHFTAIAEPTPPPGDTVQ